MDDKVLKEKLNREQYEAVTYEPAPLMVLAGAGSGKTRVLTYRFAYLYENYDIHYSRILAITFTNKAANEMKVRITKLLKNSLGMEKLPWIMTFHRQGLIILRRFLDVYREELIEFVLSKTLGKVRDSLRLKPRQIRLNAGFTIIDRNKEMSIIKTLLLTKGFIKKKKEINTKHLEIFLNRIEKERNQGITPGAGALGVESNRVNRMWPSYEKNWPFPEIKPVDLYFMLEEYLYQNNMLRLSDLIFWPYVMVHHQQFLEELQTRWDAILIDEFQDVNTIQYIFVKRLAEKHQNITVVGDQQQSIYGWRGANPTFVKSFENDFHPHVVFLTKNYRSKQNIVEIANAFSDALILHHRFKMSNTKESGNDAITYRVFQNNEEEAAWVAQQIKVLVGTGKYAYKDIAILYRLNKQARTLEKALLINNIPYHVVKGRRLYETAVAQMVLALLTVIQAPFDLAALERLMYNKGNCKGPFYFSGFGDKKQQLLLSTMLVEKETLENRMPLWYQMFPVFAYQKVLYQLHYGEHRKELESVLPTLESLAAAMTIGTLLYQYSLIDTETKRSLGISKILPEIQAELGLPEYIIFYDYFDYYSHILKSFYQNYQHQSVPQTIKSIKMYRIELLGDGKLYSQLAAEITNLFSKRGRKKYEKTIKRFNKRLMEQYSKLNIETDELLKKFKGYHWGGFNKKELEKENELLFLFTKGKSRVYQVFSEMAEYIFQLLYSLQQNVNMFEDIFDYLFAPRVENNTYTKRLFSILRAIYVKQALTGLEKQKNVEVMDLTKIKTLKTWKRAVHRIFVPFDNSFSSFLSKVERQFDENDKVNPFAYWKKRGMWSLFVSIINRLLANVQIQKWLKKGKDVDEQQIKGIIKRVVLKTVQKYVTASAEDTIFWLERLLFYEYAHYYLYRVYNNVLKDDEFFASYVLHKIKNYIYPQLLKFVKDPENNIKQSMNLSEFVDILLPLLEQATSFAFKKQCFKKEKYQADFDAFKGYLSNYKHINKMFDNLFLVSDQDGIDEKNTVKLMTVHASKGLEFPVIFLISVSKGIMPYLRAKDENTDEQEARIIDLSQLSEEEIDELMKRNYEEEKRIFYVALTRAQEKLYISSIFEYVDYRSNKLLSISPFVYIIGLNPRQKFKKQVGLHTSNFFKRVEENNKQHTKYQKYYQKYW